MARTTRTLLQYAWALLAAGMVGHPVHADETQALEFFERSVRPIFAEHCYECHGPDKQKSDLRMDHISLILKGGERGPAIVPGGQAPSLLLTAIRYGDPDLQMPPKRQLTAEQVAVIERWVQLGAPWPDEPAPGSAPAVKEFDIEARKQSHWSWQPIRPSTPPRVADEKWPLNELDRYILAKLEEARLRPAPPAENRTWLRRVYFDIVGLPPTADQVAAFVADHSPHAYEKVVDELLRSPRFGERWGRHWLDLVRYAETYGHEFDYPIAEAWRYRDYVIRALNADLPYHQFVLEHIAGDLLENPRRHPTEGYNESIIATGAWYLHEQTHAPTDPLQHEADRIDNQIDVLSKAFLGLTVSCARCHDHKFDAISTKDYYALTGYFKSSRQQYALLDPHGKITQSVAELQELRQRGDTLLSEWSGPGEPASSSAAKHPQLFESFNSGTYEGWYPTGWAFGQGPTREGQWGAAALPGAYAEPGVAHSGMLGEKLSGALRSRTFTITEPYIYLRMAGKAGQVRVIIDGYTMDVFNALLFRGLAVNVNTDGKFVWHTVGEDYSRYIGHRAHIEILDHGDGWVAVDQIWFGKEPPAAAGDHGPPTRLVPQELAAQLDDLGHAMRKVNESTPHPMRVLAMADGTPEDNRVFIRGSYKSPGEVAPRAFLEAIHGTAQTGDPHGSGRLELANRVLDHANPYTARVVVNRIWHHMMGRGIVPFTDNFGVLGEPPSHPELLDHLADRFKKENGSLKSIIRYVALSQTYRMSAAANDSTAEARDPGNVRLHRMNVRRLQGEAIRDAVLAVSGALNEQLYGPSVPVHLTPFMEGRGRPGQSGPIDGNGRRSVYLEVRRNFLSPMLLAFDAPSPFTTIGRRSISNVPAQALIMMNDPFVVQQAQAWAERIVSAPGLNDNAQRIRAMYLEAFAREPREAELLDAAAFLRDQMQYHSETSDHSPQSWADFAHVLFNLKEFVFID